MEYYLIPAELISKYDTAFSDCMKIDLSKENLIRMALQYSQNSTNNGHDYAVYIDAIKDIFKQ